MLLDPTYLLCMAPAFILMAIATWYVRAAYSKWSRVANQSGITGVQAAQRLIMKGGLSGIQIQGIAGNLTDNYDPRTKILHLSRGVAEVPSIASVAVAAHELGHAMQDNEGYFPLRFRSALVPMVSIGSSLGWILIMVGLFLAYLGMAMGTTIAWLGVAAFAGGAIFAFATLPVELNASARARRLLSESGVITTSEEMRGVSTVLNAAALTYVASLVTAVLQLLYFVGLVRRRR
jgi:hypothetical protein